MKEEIFKQLIHSERSDREKKQHHRLELILEEKKQEEHPGAWIEFMDRSHQM